MTVPTIFLSTTSDDLKDWREVLHKAFERSGCKVYTQGQSLGASSRDVPHLLLQHLDKSDFVIHLAGIAYGSEPETPAFPDHPEFHCSYTQFEYYYAHQQHKHVIAFVCAENFPYLSFTEKATDDADRIRRQNLQQAHRQRVSQGYFTDTPLAGHPIRPLSETVADVSKLLQAVAAAVGTIHDSTNTLSKAKAELEDLASKRHDELLAYLKDLPSQVADELQRRQLIKPAFEFKADIARITDYAPVDLIGREADLNLITQAWQQAQNQSRNRPHILTFVALGGEGKTSLVAHWLIENLVKQDWQGCDTAFAWSFYSQGTREQVAASSDLFLSEALTFFGDETTANSAKSAHDKGKRLAQLVGGQRSVLVLDGLEPLQYPPTSPTPGELKDDGIKALLKTLASQNHGLCLVTTRYAIPDLKAFRTSTAPMHDLKRLSSAAGVHLLKQLGVHGAQKDFEKLVEDVQGHALSLNLLGTYLKDAHGGDIRKRDLINFAEANAEEHNGHAFRIMDAYLAWLEQGSAGVSPATNPNQSLAERSRSQLNRNQHSQNQQLAPALLKLLGLFDRPATADCLAALWQAPAIEGLTEAIVASNTTQRNMALSRLETAKLLTVTRDTSGTLLALDSHPLIREYFAKYLKERQPQAFQAAHQRIYQHLCDSTPHQPDSLEGLQPLYQAVAHGCLAGLQQEVCEQVYIDRILRGANYKGFFSTNNLGAFGTDLSAVAYFFETPWSRITPALTESYQALLLAIAAFNLRALGRLTEALEPMRAVLNSDVKMKRWLEAAISANNLSELELTLGDIKAALIDAKLAVRYADECGDLAQRLARRTTYADALHEAGQINEAAETFRQAEAIQSERTPNKPLLSSLWGHRYCDLLLAGQGFDAINSKPCHNSNDSATILGIVLERATKTLKWAEQNNASLLTFALDHLTLGRTYLYRFILETPASASTHTDEPPELSTTQLNYLKAAEIELEAAVEGLRCSEQQFLPRGLLTRAWLRRLCSQLGYADEGLDKACLSNNRSEKTGFFTPENANDGLPNLSPSDGVAQACPAQADLDEAYDIAERGPMPLFLADIHLYRAGLFHNANPYPWKSPQHDLAEARRLIEKHGYWRRKAELEGLEQRLL